MDRPILIAILMMCIVTVANSQKAGFGIGATFSNFTSREENDFDKRFNMMANFFLEIDISDKMSIQPEWNFMTLGAKKLELSDSSLQITKTQKLTYWNISSVLNYHTSKSISIQLGSYIGLLRKASISSPSGYITSTSTVDNNTNQFRRIDLGFMLGISAEEDEIVYNLRFRQGLVNISDELGINKNYVLELLVKYRFENLLEVLGR